jgi:hypothetical protein
LLRPTVFITVCAGNTEPHICGDVVPYDASTSRIHHSKIKLRLGVTLLGGGVVPAYGFNIVVYYDLIKNTGKSLGPSVALIS